MALTEKELLKLKEDVEDAKTESSQLLGQQKALMQQLKEDWGCKTTEEAEEKLETMRKQSISFDKKIEKATNELELKLNQPEEEADDQD